MLRAVLNKSLRQHPTRHQLYGHLPPITKTIQVRRTRHAEEGRPARTYIQQLFEDTACCPEDLPRAMNNREKWRERVRDIRATSVTWWWYSEIYVYTEPTTSIYEHTYTHTHTYIYIYIYIYLQVWILSKCKHIWMPLCVHVSVIVSQQ